MSMHLCGCGAVIVQERGFVHGRYTATFYDIEGARLEQCPGCGLDLMTAWGPSEEEIRRESSLPPHMLARPTVDDGLFR